LLLNPFFESLMSHLEVIDLLGLSHDGRGLRALQDAEDQARGLGVGVHVLALQLDRQKVVEQGLVSLKIDHLDYGGHAGEVCRGRGGLDGAARGGAEPDRAVLGKSQSRVLTTKIRVF
jgi:hypothetical protein